MTHLEIPVILKILTQEKTEKMETTLTIRWLKELANEFGLAYIEREGTVTVVGEKQNILFNTREGSTCQVIEIY